MKCYFKGMFLDFSESYSAFVTKTYWVLQKEEIVNMKIFLLFTHLKLHNIRGTYCKYFKIIFTKLVFHLRLSKKLPDVISQEFCMHLMYELDYCI